LIALIIDAHPSAEVAARPCARRMQLQARSTKDQFASNTSEGLAVKHRSTD
jgi:hypothetical protein